jgi:hypothetical protein
MAACELHARRSRTPAEWPRRGGRDKMDVDESRMDVDESRRQAGLSSV